MSLNWPQLFAKGRCKDIGIPWSDEESEALEKLIAHTGLERAALAPFVREGVLTIEEYEVANAGGDKKPTARAELEGEAKKLGLQFAPETPDTVLKGQITRARNKAKEAEEAAKLEEERKAADAEAARVAAEKDAEERKAAQEAAAAEAANAGGDQNATDANPNAGDKTPGV